MILHLGQDFLGEEILYGIGRDRMEDLVNGDTNTLLALTHAEGTAQLYLVTDVMLGNEALKLGYDLARALNVAGATDTNDNFHHDVFPFDVKNISRMCRSEWSGRESMRGGLLFAKKSLTIRQAIPIYYSTHPLKNQ